MGYQLTTVHVAYETVNEYGRRGDIILISPSKWKAEAAAKGRGWWGSDGLVVEKWALLASPTSVYLLESSTRYPLDADIPEDLKTRREKARAKLTDEEAKLLGIE